jgi:hypothetical protein
MTPIESKIQQLVDNVQVNAQEWIDELDSITWVGGTGKHNPFYRKHHTDASIRKMNETKIRNGTLGRFPEKALTLLRIAKELDDAGVDRVKIASLALKQMRENGMKISQVHAYRILPQKYKNQYRVVACRNNRIGK